jgi:hypothetical protein
MNTPQKILKEYLNGIDQVLDSNPPEKEVKEITRMKHMFLSSIGLINQFNDKSKTKKTIKYINSVVRELEKQLEFEKNLTKKLKYDMILLKAKLKRKENISE